MKDSSFQKGSRRCAQLVRCLRENYAYSEKRPRDLLFTSMERVLGGSAAGGQDLILAKLTREAAAFARVSAEIMGVQCSNWDMTSRAVVNAMLGAGVLLDADGSPLTAGIAAQASRVRHLANGYRDRTEGYLVWLLIAKRGDVRMQDHVALGHALFRQFDPRIPAGDMEDRVVHLLALLADRLTLSEDGVYAVRDDFGIAVPQFNATHA